MRASRIRNRSSVGGVTTTVSSISGGGDVYSNSYSDAYAALSTWADLATVTATVATTWTDNAAVTSPRPTTWAVLNAAGPATLVFTAGTPYQANASVTTSGPITYPTGTTTGDYTLLVCAFNGSSGTIIGPTGWTAVLDSTNATVSTSAVHAIFSKPYVAGDAAPVVTCTNGRLAVLPVRVQGADTATFIEVPASVTQQRTAGTTIDAPTLTSTASNVLCCTFMGRSATSGIIPSFTPPAGTTEVGEASGVSSVTNAAVSFNVSTITPGVASGTRTGTASVTITGGMGVSFIIRRG